jgi:hypothetical protein
MKVLLLIIIMFILTFCLSELKKMGRAIENIERIEIERTTHKK